MSVLDQAIPDTMRGVDLTKAETLPRMGYNYISILGGTYEVSSVWDRGGGHIFCKLPLRKRALFSLRGISRGLNCTAYRNKLKRSLRFLSAIRDGTDLLRHLGSDHIKYLSPQISVEEARAFMEKVEDGVVLQEKTTVLSEETKMRLRNLGYID